MKAETERLIGRLMSSDPDFDDCTDAANLLRRYYRDSHGPDGLPWKDAAVSERVRRVAVEQQNAELRERIDLATSLLGAAPEINPINYDHDQVCALNDAANQVCNLFNEALASQPTSHNTDREDEWPTWPRVGKRYLVWFSGVLQHETYEFDRGDDGMGGGEYFWGRDDVDECPPFDPDNHRWLALDDIDAARAGEVKSWAKQN